MTPRVELAVSRTGCVLPFPPRDCFNPNGVGEGADLLFERAIIYEKIVYIKVFYASMEWFRLLIYQKDTSYKSSNI